MGSDAEEAEMTEFCAAVGELVIWGNMIDHQLNQVTMKLFALPDHPLIEPLIGQLDARPKAEIIKKRLKLLPKGNDWRTGVESWVKNAEKTLTNRNVVAHHRVQIDPDGGIVLATSQMTKILDSITPDMKPVPKKGLKEIQEWIAQAKRTMEESTQVLDNLDRFADRIKAEAKF